MDSEIKDRQFSLSSITTFLRGRFDLNEDKASEQTVKDSIRKGVEFKGINLWVLIFATFVASLGLNVNSAAVIIGAMLISPLMGPIMGMGFSVGINDFELLKKAIRNFGFMCLVSFVTSTIYFTLSPLSQTTSELLARTSPTTYDVLIAFFGGLAGIVAQSRKDPASTVISGVAIATALMPPLCTAGYGLATLQFSYFFGAAYLFFINTVFIAIATFLVVRFLKYKKKEFADKAREKTVRRYMIVIMIVTTIPSVVIGYGLVQKSIFESNADKYVKTVLQFSNARVIDYNKTFVNKNNNSINVGLLGEVISPDVIDNARLQLVNFGLKNTQLYVHQSSSIGGESLGDYAAIQSNYRDLVLEKNKKIAELESQVSRFSVDTIAGHSISSEIFALSPGIHGVLLSRGLEYEDNGSAKDTILVCIVKTATGSLSQNEQQRLSTWLKARTKSSIVKFYVD